MTCILVLVKQHSYFVSLPITLISSLSVKLAKELLPKLLHMFQQIKASNNYRWISYFGEYKQKGI